MNINRETNWLGDMTLVTVIITVKVICKQVSMTTKSSFKDDRCIGTKEEPAESNGCNVAGSVPRPCLMEDLW